MGQRARTTGEKAERESKREGVRKRAKDGWHAPLIKVTGESHKV